MTERTLKQVIPGAETSDGAGVRIKRSLGQQPSLRLDPFLMLDEFGSAEASDYIAGFPSHPHRGFETVTYMIEGHMLHEDHLGNRGDLRNGGVQWMTAGRGIIHSEMPQQEEGVMRGFQLWLNLPAAEKMTEAGYHDIQPEDIPDITIDGGRIKLIAGTVEIDGAARQGAVSGRSTQPVYADILLDANARATLPVPATHNGLVYLYEGEASVGDRELQRHAASVLGDGDRVSVTAGAQGARLLLIAGKPIGEPVVQYGPFVMNTREEIEQALQDFRDGRLTA
ncbi:pirin family protein [Marinobacter arenosus]|uniref:pirin family protein n=1 Tax=Marinobacter arenosus TaxID=2856822 RepID=UPI001C4C0010|nr:pirin family protein [Marinobacter arenosus]MBW0147702.1 pirin family protein [Marinobacter arenosus]